MQLFHELKLKKKWTQGICRILSPTSPPWLLPCHAMPGPFHLIQGEMPTPGCMPCLVAYPGCEGSCRFGTVSLMDGGVAMAMATSTKPPPLPPWPCCSVSTTPLTALTPSGAVKPCCSTPIKRHIWESCPCRTIANDQQVEELQLELALELCCTEI